VKKEITGRRNSKGGIRALGGDFLVNLAGGSGMMEGFATEGIAYFQNEMEKQKKVTSTTGATGEGRCQW